MVPPSEMARNRGYKMRYSWAFALKHIYYHR